MSLGDVIDIYDSEQGNECCTCSLFLFLSMGKLLDTNHPPRNPLVLFLKMWYTVIALLR